MVNRVQVEVLEIKGLGYCDGCGTWNGCSVGDSWTYPDGMGDFCKFALNALLPSLMSFSTSGSSPEAISTGVDGVSHECCPDGLRPVVFTISRIEENGGKQDKPDAEQRKKNKAESEKTKVLITVKEIQGRGWCSMVDIGYRWVYPDDLNGLCPQALNSLLPVLWMLKYGGVHAQTEITGEKDTVLVSCHDHTRPVIYECTRFSDDVPARRSRGSADEPPNRENMGIPRIDGGNG